MPNSNVNSGGPESSEDDTEVLDRQPKLEVGNSTFYHSTEVIHTDEEQEELKSQEFIFGSEEPFVEEEVDVDKTHQVWSLFHFTFFSQTTAFKQEKRCILSMCPCCYSVVQKATKKKERHVGLNFGQNRT